MIARLTVQRGKLTEYPLAERTRGGWQNGVTFYPDAEVRDVQELTVRTVQGEPTFDASQTPLAKFGRSVAERFSGEPQGEPSEAAVVEAVHAIGLRGFHVTAAAMRAALRAAGEVGR